jgi:arsenite-transporting ATPase
VLPDAVVDGIEESLSGACTTEIAAFDEFTALLTDAALTQDYAHIIFDTAPPATPSACCNCRAHGAAFWKQAKAMSCLGPLAAWKNSAVSTRLR